MTPWLRFAPLGVVTLLITIKANWDDFLSGHPVSWLPWLSWFAIALVPLAYLAAWCLSPIFVRVINHLALRWVIPPLIFILLGVGVVWFVEGVYDHTLAAWFGWGQVHLVDALTRVIFGGL